MFVDNTTARPTFWVGSNHGASIVRVEPQDWRRLLTDEMSAAAVLAAAFFDRVICNRMILHRCPRC
jgi:hypothetical protein